jgi:PilZ domain-containing protein
MGFMKRLVEKLLGKEHDDTTEGSLPLLERRSAVRLNHRVELNVQYETQVLPAVLVNLTFTGLSFKVSRELETGTNVTLMREELGPSFNGTVLWSRKTEQDYLVGVECELDEEHLLNSWLLPALEEAGFRPEFASEQRRQIRHPHPTLCVLSDGEGTTYYDISILDLSLGGALVKCHQELTPGTSLKIRTEKPGFSCQSIVRSVQEKDSMWHCSLEFENPDEQELKDFLNTRA